MRKLPLLLSIVLLIPILARADVIVLKDGTRLEGEVKRTPDGWTVTTADGKSRTVTSGAVKSIELGSSQRNGQQSAEGLASLRRSVEALTDINQVIERYQRFIDNTKDAKTLAEAQIDLSMWRDRREKGLVKHGSQWVPPEEVASIVAKASSFAEEAREHLRGNRQREAEQLLSQALEVDPKNPAALYLRGVMLYRQDKLTDARKAFETVNSVIPSHAPTANNLGVLLYRANQQVGALNYFDQAMQAQPVNKFILNNVCEALGVLPEEQRKNPAVAKVARRFAEQDLILQQQMQQQGLYRWGGQWVDQKRLDELKAAERQAREKLEAMQAEFDQTKARIAQIDEEIARNESSMEDMKARSVYQQRDRDGNVIFLPLPLPQAYYDLQHENRQLAQDQAALRTKLTSMQEHARRVQQQVPVPQFTGIQQIVGVEGMPGPEEMPSPSSLTTAPTG
jgi:Flp pilus assembly protein TadD